MNYELLTAPPGKKIKLKDYPPDYTDPIDSKDEAAEKLARDIAKLSSLQAKLYAQDTFALLVILQGIDASGKDGTIKHVMSGVNPSGCQVTSFKAPSSEELDHDYLWRCVQRLPPRGMIGIFNRSYYEEVLVVRVHPEMLDRQQVPRPIDLNSLWKQRYRQINQFEQYLTENGVVVLKFFLNLSKEEQKRRFLERIEAEDKNWKFSAADVREREFWDNYIDAFEDMLSNTSTEIAPWHVIPADRKWFSRCAVADIIVRKLESLDVRFPRLDGEQKKALDHARQLLLNEK
jgi:PPK2 family polyphosphate:nucleotide phosphotransferase